MPETEETAAGPVANILIVDDDPSKLIALRAVLDPLGANVVEARSGADALRHLLKGDFAVILLDVRMPIMSGFENIREHMEVIGADGVHIGTVDKVEDNRIKLIRADSGVAHEGIGRRREREVNDIMNPK